MVEVRSLGKLHGGFGSHFHPGADVPLGGLDRVDAAELQYQPTPVLPGFFQAYPLAPAARKLQPDLLERVEAGGEVGMKVGENLAAPAPRPRDPGDRDIAALDPGFHLLHLTG